MNFFYIENEVIIYCVSIFTDVKFIEKIVPKGLKIYIYKTKDEIQNLIKNDIYAGIGNKEK